MLGGRGRNSGWLVLHPDTLGHKEPVGKEVMTKATASKIAHDSCKNTFGYCNHTLGHLSCISVTISNAT